MFRLDTKQLAFMQYLFLKKCERALKAQRQESLHGLLRRAAFSDAEPKKAHKHIQFFSELQICKI
jgi:hypothetical protein